TPSDLPPSMAISVPVTIAAASLIEIFIAERTPKAATQHPLVANVRDDLPFPRIDWAAERRN
ncbi:MAG: hypothetical protein ACE5KM_22735, partial [Planctomycetaceae bacterium]